MLNHINLFGIESFNNAIFYGAFNEVALDYIHPTDKLSKLENFNIIQNAFILAIC